MSYSLTKLEQELVSFKKKIDNLVEENCELEEALQGNKITLSNYESNINDLEATISKLKGETK